MAEILRLGRVGYRVAWALQEHTIAAIAEGRAPNTVIVCEHDPVYTVGRKRGALANVLDPGDVPVLEVERGGDVTWHGPGQLVAYPMIRLDGAARDLHAHLHRLEELMIGVCADLGLSVGRDPRNTGVWSEGRKVGSIGIACRRWVTWHGCALNVDPDLRAYSAIHPCGFDADIMTSVSRALGRPVPLAEAEEALVTRVAGW